MLVGKVITSASVFWPGTLEKISAEQFMLSIRNQKILAVLRWAKYIDLQFSDFHVFIHLRMSGDLVIKEHPYSPEKHDRIVFTMEDGNFLVFNDTRKFGRVWLTSNPEDVIGNLGPEPFSPDFTPAELHAKLISHHRMIKPLLLDQSFLSGLGNIYSDEALFLSKIHPQRNSDTINLDEAVRLYQAIQVVLNNGIEHNGASIDWVYRGGSFQNHFHVYARENQPCQFCGTPIIKIVVGQRGTHFCPVCQPGIPSGHF